jgi:hypothetical protein
MVMLRGWWLPVLLGITPLSHAGDIQAGASSDLSVTVYRAPGGTGRLLDLDSLQGFALISETRTIRVPAGSSRVRFEGVADGIQADTAVISGLPVAVVEKNRDARVLSPSELVAAALGHEVKLIRTVAKSGISTQISGTLRSDADGGVIFESSHGLEALRCSGFPETFHYSAATDLASSPTLSVLINSPESIDATVTLSYLSGGFDWGANYVATLSKDGTKMNLGAWVTLGNGNAATFASARAQVVAGRINHETGEVVPVEVSPSILASCWPRGSTSDIPAEPVVLVTAARRSSADLLYEKAAPMPAMRAAAQLVQEEQLGDLKLYRVPERTSVMSRQIKQVRLLEREDVPVQTYCSADLAADQNARAVAVRRILRTTNDEAHHLGLPLPSGRVDTSVVRGDATLLVSETPLRDIAVGERLEFGLGGCQDVHVEAVLERTSVRGATVDRANRIELRNAYGKAVPVELRLALRDSQLIAADPAPSPSSDGARRLLFKLTVPAGGGATIHYKTQQPR